MLPLMRGLAATGAEAAVPWLEGGDCLRCFTFFADYLREKLHLTTVVANELEIMDGKLTGQVIGDIVDAQYKANTLARLAEKYMKSRWSRPSPSATARTTLPMIKLLVLAFAYHAKPK